jgi:hypothetical protein
MPKTETENGTTLNLNPKRLKQAKVETKNATTLTLNLKNAETESENGRFISVIYFRQCLYCMEIESQSQQFT